METLKINYKETLNMLDVQHVDTIHKENNFLKATSKHSNPFKSYGNLFMLRTVFPMRGASLELCIDLGPQCNIV